MLISTALGAAAVIVAAGPSIIAIGVAFLAGMALDALDQKYNLTKTLIKKLDDLADSITTKVDEAESAFTQFINR